MIHYAEIGPDDRVLQCIHVESADAAAAVEPNEGCTLQLLTEPIDWSAATSETTVMFWNDGTPEFRETLSISEVVIRSLKKIDHVADITRTSVVGDPVRVKEYERAEQQAKAFQNAGFEGPVPSSVGSWATAKGWTPQLAAEDILSASLRWYTALDGIRALRLIAKESVRNALTISEINNTTTNFSTTLLSIMQGVQ